MDLASLQLVNERVNELVSHLKHSIGLIAPPVPDVSGAEPPSTLPAVALPQMMPGLGMSTEASVIQRFVEAIDQGLFTIQVLGKFKNGKSTLLNALLGTKFLPARAIPTTAIITTIVYGTRTDVAIYRHNIVQPEYISQQEFFERFQLKQEDQRAAETGRLDRFSDIEFAQIESQHEICAARVRLVDSPGLGEHVNRTRAAVSFLSSAQAVVYVLSALAILEQNDTQVIQERLGDGRLDHVFFVVNRINQIDQEDIPSVQEWVRGQLNKHFVDSHNLFDESFYGQRVFFVDAKGALDLRQAAANGGLSASQYAALEATQVPGFEESLRRFLTSPDRLRAIYSSALQILERTRKLVHERILVDTHALQRDLGALKESERKARQDLGKLEEREEEIGRIILREGELLAGTVNTELASFVRQFQRQFDQHPFAVPEITAAEVVAAGGDDVKNNALKQRIRAAVNEYLNARFKEWGNSLQQTINKPSEEAKQRIRDEVVEFLRDVAVVRREVAGLEQHQIDFSEIVIEPESITDTIVLGHENWSVTIIKSLDGLAGLLGRFGARGVRAYAAMYRLADPLFRWIDETFGKEIVERTNRQFLDRFHRTVMEEIQKALLDDIEKANWFIAGSVSNPREFARRLLHGDDPLSPFLRGHLSSEVVDQLTQLAQSQDESPDHYKTMVDIVNQIVNGELIYAPDRFTHVHLDDEIRRVIADSEARRRLSLDINRWLLTHAYPEFLAEKVRDTIYLRLAFEFRQIAENITVPLRSHLDETRTQIDAIVHKRTTSQPATNHEIARLRWLGAEFDALVDDVKRLSTQEIA